MPVPSLLRPAFLRYAPRAFALACAAAVAGCNLFSTQDDFRAPAVTLVAPDTAVTEVAGEVVVRLAAEPRGTDNTVASAQIIVGGMVVGDASPTSPPTTTITLTGQPPRLSRVRTFAYTLDTRTLPDGEHRLEAVAFDARGARGTSRSIRLIVRNGDGSGPLVRIVSPAEGDSVRGRVSVVVRPEAGQPEPSGVDLFVDGLARASFSGPPYEWVWDTRAEAVGAHRLQARASRGPNTRLSPVVTVVVRDTVVRTTDPTFGFNCTLIRCTRFRTTGLTGAPAGVAQSLGGVLYVATRSGALYGLDRAGSVVSLFQTGGDLVAPPLVSNGDNVFVTDRAGRLHGFAPSGTRLWDAYDAGAAVTAAPALGPTGTLFFGDAQGRVHAVSPSTGRAVAGFPVQVAAAAINAPVAIDRDAHLYVLAADGRAYSLSAAGAPRWISADNLGAGGIAPALTEHTEGATRVTTLYVVSTAGRLSAVAGATGATAWSAPLAGTPTSGAVVGPDGGIFVGTSTGLAAFNEVIPGNGTRQRFVLALPEVLWPTVDAAGTIHVVAGTEIVSVGPSGTVAGRYLLGGRVAAPPVLTRDGVLVAQRTDGLVTGVFLNQTLAPEKWPTYGRSSRHTFRLGDDARD